ncbi:hypothetical protein JMJ35_009055 [Cladonia borealis]|uniref:Uncharacterized protein n=1 Tax=Cladonia borealis TaxID=184061 RepID=A0AA39QUW2_9LECA|nr:hypothetical protein JMJ35_009055 [Cladonia borealis]
MQDDRLHEWGRMTRSTSISQSISNHLTFSNVSNNHSKYPRPKAQPYPPKANPNPLNMKFIVPYLALAASFSPFAFTAPTSENALVGRQTPADAPAALARLQTLFTSITPYTGQINSTAASLTPSSSEADKVAAGTTFTSTIASINSQVVDATNDIKAMGAAKKRDVVAIEARQDALTGLPAELALIIEEIGGALNEIIATLGLTATLSFLGPLVSSLSALIASLIPVVNDLLAVVEELLDGILGGLSAALAGLVL